MVCNQLASGVQVGRGQNGPRGPIMATNQWRKGWQPQKWVPSGQCTRRAYAYDASSHAIQSDGSLDASGSHFFVKIHGCREMGDMRRWYGSRYNQLMHLLSMPRFPIFLFLFFLSSRPFLTLSKPQISNSGAAPPPQAMGRQGGFVAVVQLSDRGPIAGIAGERTAPAWARQFGQRARWGLGRREVYWAGGVPRAANAARCPLLPV